MELVARNIMKFIFSFLVYFNFILTLESQVVWERINNLNNHLTNDIALDKNGNLFIAIEGHEDIYTANILNDKLEYKALPRIQTRPFFSSQNQVRLMIDTNNHLLALFGYGGEYIPYKYQNNAFSLDGSFDSTGLMVVPDATIANKEGKYSVNYLSDIYQMNKKWKLDSSTLVFSTKNINELIYRFFPYEDSINYAFVGGLPYQYDVYQYDTKKLVSKKIIHIGSLDIDPYHVEITEDGHLFLPTRKGLYNYLPDLKTIDIPILDPNDEPYKSITDLRFSKKGNILIAQSNEIFYFSYDTGRTWIKPILFNANFPKGVISKLEVLDSTRAIAQIIDDCFSKNSYVLHPRDANWKQADINIQYWNYSDLKKSNENTKRLFAIRDLCYFEYTEDNGKHWNRLKCGEKDIDNLLFNLADNMISYFARDSFVYISSDQGMIWNPIFEAEGNIERIYELHDNTFFLISLLQIRNEQDKYFYYVSNDGCKSWELIYSGQSLFPSNGRMIWDPSGQILVLTGKKVLSSQDNGRTWIEDKRFTGIELRNIFFINKDYILLDAKINKRNWTYSTTDFKVFEALDPGFTGYRSYPVSYVLSNDYIGLFSATEGLRISGDRGKTWNDVTKGINIDTSIRYTLFNSFFIDKDKTAYISLAYDGIYKSIKALVDIKAVPKNSDSGNFVIQPNPTNGFIAIQLNNHSNYFEYDVYVYNSFGQVVITKTINEQNMILDLANLKPGNYILKIRNGKQILLIEKIVKM